MKKLILLMLLCIFINCEIKKCEGGIIKISLDSEKIEESKKSLPPIIPKKTNENVVNDDIDKDEIKDDITLYDESLIVSIKSKSDLKYEYEYILTNKCTNILLIFYSNNDYNVGDELFIMD